MEIFTEEFKNELSKQLHELTNVVKKDTAGLMSDSEIAKSMEDCFIKEIKIERNKNNKKFKLGDVVYFCSLEGVVVDFCNESNTIDVDFKNGYLESFMNDGSLIPNTPIVLSHYPYKLKKKKSKH